MPRSRLRWRALAVLGALLSVMIDWPIGFAMPATNNQQIQTMTKINSCVNSASVNCSAANNLNLTNSDRVTDRSAGSDSRNTNSSDSGKSGENPSSDSKNSPKQQTTMLLSSFASVDQRIIANSNRSIRPDRLMRIYNKRKRKKTVARLTADLLRSIRTHNTSFNSDVNNLINIKNNISENQLNSSSETNNLSNFNNSVESSMSESIGTATVQSIVDNATISQYLSRTDRSVHFNPQLQTPQRKVNDSNLDRNERSANLSQISGPARKIQLYIKNRFIQVLPDGTINGTQDDLSDYTILQRTTVDVGQIKIQGVATCLFLCMDQCGAVYGSKSFTDDCVFNESMEQHHYNTYSSTYNSNFRTLYLALNRHGVPRKVIIPRTRSLEKLATYTKALTENVPQDRVEKLIARTFGANRVKHGLRQLCDAGKPLIELTASVMKSRPKCNNSNNANGQSAAVAAPSVVSEKLSRINNNHSSSNSSSSSSGSHSKTSNSNSGNLRKKKKKRRCRLNEDELEHNCHRPKAQALKKRAQNRKCLQTPEECTAARKKNNNGKKQKGPNQAGQKKRKVNGNRKGKAPTSTVQTTIVSTTPTTTTELETSTTTQTTTTLRSASTHTIRQSNEEDVSTEESQQSSTETHEDSDGEDDDSSISSLGGHAQLVNGDDFLYDDEFDV